MDMIVACAQNSVIASQGRLPWHLPEDLAYFKAQVKGACVVMGKETFLGMPRLSSCFSLVISTSLADTLDEGAVLRDPKEVLRYADRCSRMWIIGGQSIYTYFLPYIHHLYMTEVHTVVKGDRYFPEWPREQFMECSREPHYDASAQLHFDFVVYQNQRPEVLS